MRIFRHILTIAIVLPIFFLVLATAYSVFMRYWANSPVTWMEEVSGLCMIWLVMIGAIAAERDDENLSIPLFVDLLQYRLGLIVNLVVTAFSVVVLGYLGWLGYVLSQKVAFKVTSILKVSWFWIDIAIPVGAAGMAFFMILRAVKQLRGYETSL